MQRELLNLCFFQTFAELKLPQSSWSFENYYLLIAVILIDEVEFPHEPLVSWTKPNQRWIACGFSSYLI